MALDTPAPVMNPFTPEAAPAAPMGGGLPPSIMQFLSHFINSQPQVNQALPPQPMGAPSMPAQAPVQWGNGQNPASALMTMLAQMTPGAQGGMNPMAMANAHLMHGGAVPPAVAARILAGGGQVPTTAAPMGTYMQHPMATPPVNPAMQNQWDGGAGMSQPQTPVAPAAPQGFGGFGGGASRPGFGLRY